MMPPLSMLIYPLLLVVGKPDPKCEICAGDRSMVSFTNAGPFALLEVLGLVVSILTLCGMADGKYFLAPFFILIV